MKKVLITLMLAFTGLFVISNAVEVSAAEGEKVVIHYYKLAGDIDGVGVWTWGNGTGGSENGIPATGVDAEGWATVELNVDKATMGDTGWFIPFGHGFTGEPIGAWPSFGDSAKDSASDEFDGQNVFYDRIAFKASEDKVLDVYFVQGQALSYLSRDEALIAAGLAVEDAANPGQIDENFLVVTYVYYDPTGEYEDWNIWAWATDGATPADGSGYDFSRSVDIVFNGITGEHKVAYFITDISKATESTKLGFILRTDAWAKKYPDDIFYAMDADFLASGYATLYYLAGEGELRNNLEEFLTEAYAFKLSTAIASSQTQIQITANKDIKTVSVDEEGASNVVFDKSWIVLKDKDGVVVPVQDVLYDSTVSATKNFSLVLAEANKLDPAKAPYEVSFAYEGQSAVSAISYDIVAPTFTLIDSANQRVEVGSTWALGIYSANDDVDGVLTPFVTASGVVDTSKLGTYTVTLSVQDSLGNVGTQTITVTVYDPCDDEAATAYAWVFMILAPLVIAGFAIKKFAL
ncbi:MAG: pullulanase-associated domain-containing protein [Acholeplasma sp.]|nr:pullulanase-associated domain-containing protein [Acholeplasma sp.]